MAITDPPVGTTSDQRRAVRSIDSSTRQRLLMLLRKELARASAEALAHGTSPEELAKQLDERTARLRAQIAELLTAQTTAGEDVANSAD